MNDQEKLWQGEFGDAYHERNLSQYRLDFWLKVLKDIPFNLKSVLELGAGKGDNLAALHLLIPGGRFTGVEINHKAAEAMRRRHIDVIEKSYTDIGAITPRHDLVLTRGFLIHVPEADLPLVYALMYNTSTRYICMAEYYSQQRREISYRGYADALWSDDFAAGIMTQYPDLKLIDYGFHYHVDGGDDLNWFLLEKKQR